MTDRLKNQHETIEQLIAGKSVSRLDLHPAGNKWSIRDNITHLATYQPIFIERINTILREEAPFFERYKADDDPNFEKRRTDGIPELLAMLNKDRLVLFQLIANLPEEKLSRVGIHKKFGKLTLLQWVEFFLLHEAHHLFTIFQIANDSEIADPVL